MFAWVRDPHVRQTLRRNEKLPTGEDHTQICQLVLLSLAARSREGLDSGDVVVFCSACMYPCAERIHACPSSFAVFTGRRWYQILLLKRPHFQHLKAEAPSRLSPAYLQRLHLNTVSIFSPRPPFCTSGYSCKQSVNS